MSHDNGDFSVGQTCLISITTPKLAKLVLSHMVLGVLYTNVQIYKVSICLACSVISRYTVHGSPSDLLGVLQIARRSLPSRPLIFVAHSLREACYRL